jgi:hypothetical protein
MTETMTGNDDVELPLVKAVLAATSLLESHREIVTSCTALLEMAGHRARVGMIWAFTAGFIVSAVLTAQFLVPLSTRYSGSVFCADYAVRGPPRCKRSTGGRARTGRSNHKPLDLIE